MINNFNDIPPAHLRLLVRIALMYYVDGHTQQEVGDQLGLSRIKVNRLLQQARELGIVEINVNIPPGVNAELEQALCNTYGLRDAVVVPEAEPGEALYLALAQGAAGWLADRLTDGMVVGIGQGRTVAAIPQVFSVSKPVDCTFVEIVGGANSKPGEFNNYNIVSKMAERAGGKASYIYAPTVVSSKANRDAFLQETSIASALDLARNAEIIVHSVGPVDRTSQLYIHGYLDDDELERLREVGAAGDTLGVFFDQSGQVANHPICDRIVSVSLDDLRQAPYCVVVSGGPAKLPALRAALYGRLMNVLVTDFATATALVEG